MTPEQVQAWLAEASRRLSALKGPYNFWGQSAPMPIQFCDGHGLHAADLNELRQALAETRSRLMSRNFGEDGPAYGVPAEQALIELFAIIANTSIANTRQEGAYGQPR